MTAENMERHPLGAKIEGYFVKGYTSDNLPIVGIFNASQEIVFKAALKKSLPLLEAPNIERITRANLPQDPDQGVVPAFVSGLNSTIAKIIHADHVGKSYTTRFLQQADIGAKTVGKSLNQILYHNQPLDQLRSNEKFSITMRINGELCVFQCPATAFSRVIVSRAFPVLQALQAEQNSRHG